MPLSTIELNRFRMCMTESGIDQDTLNIVSTCLQSAQQPGVHVETARAFLTLARQHAVKSLENLSDPEYDKQARVAMEAAIEAIDSAQAGLAPQ